MSVFEGRREAVSYGHDIGILMLDCFNPFIPGDVGNAYTYKYPVLFHVVPGLTSPLVRSGGTAVLEQVVDAARFLERQGVTAITSDCGYMLHFQDAVAAAVSIPVMLSSLLQLPFIAATMPAGSIGIICANSRQLTSGLLSQALPAATRRVVIEGMEDSPAFRGAFLDEVGRLDADEVQKEVVLVAQRLIDRNPDVGAILLECSNLPPYAQAVQRIVQKPVFDFTTMIDYMRAACRRERFGGYY